MSIKDENRVVPAFLIPHLISRQLSNCQIVKLNIMSNRQNNIQYVPSNIRCNKHYEQQIEGYPFEVKQIVYRMMGKLNEITMNDPRFRSSTWIIFRWVSMDNPFSMFLAVVDVLVLYSDGKSEGNDSDRTINTSFGVQEVRCNGTIVQDYYGFEWITKANDPRYSLCKFTKHSIPPVVLYAKHCPI